MQFHKTWIAPKQEWKEKMASLITKKITSIHKVQPSSPTPLQWRDNYLNTAEEEERHTMTNNLLTPNTGSRSSSRQKRTPITRTSDFFMDKAISRHLPLRSKDTNSQKVIIKK